MESKAGGGEDDADGPREDAFEGLVGPPNTSSYAGEFRLSETPTPIQGSPTELEFQPDLELPEEPFAPEDLPDPNPRFADPPPEEAAMGADFPWGRKPKSRTRMSGKSSMGDRGAIDMNLAGKKVFEDGDRQRSGGRRPTIGEAGSEGAEEEIRARAKRRR